MEDLLDSIYDLTGLSGDSWLYILGGITIIVIGLYFIRNYKASHKDELIYSNAKNYLQKAEEVKRSPMPLLVLLILTFAVVAESMGFSYIFSEYILADASGDDSRIAAVLGAILISGILVPLTHKTGEQIYYNKKIANLDSYISSDKDFDFNKVSSGIEVSNTNEDDDKKSRAYHLFSRIEPEIKNNKLIKKKYLPLFTLGFILMIAYGAYFVRAETYKYKSYEENQYALESSKKQELKKEKSDLPKYMVQIVKTNKELKNRAKIESLKKSNLMTYVILMVLFLGIQVLGVYSGLNYGFVGKESRRAFLDIKNYKGKK